MNSNDDITDTVIAILRGIAPILDPEELVPDEPLRDQIELDSLDWQHFLIGVDRTFGVVIPESDYPDLSTLDDVVDRLCVQLRVPAQHHGY